VPAVVLRKQYEIDSGGAGVNRGGASVLKDTMYLHAAEHWSSPLHTKEASGLGVNGGKSGALGATWVFHPDEVDVMQTKRLLATSGGAYAASTPVAGMLHPETKQIDPENGRYFYFASTPIWKTSPHAIFRYVTNGGGGWGDPLAREPERVKNDVRDEYVSIEGALRDYGVVVTGDPQQDPEGLRVDLEATERRRTELRAS